MSTGGGAAVGGRLPGEPRRVALELAVQDPGGVETAARVGARRVELCVALGATGGLTPSAGLLDAALAAARRGGAAAPGSGAAITVPEVHVLVRPRPGGFVYSAAEIDLQVRDVEAAVAAGASGVVVGALTPAGDVDVASTRELVTAARGAEVTFHRAFDVLADQAGALETLAGLGVSRVLTSGGAPRCIDGAVRLAELAARAHGPLAGAIQVMAGGGVRVEDVAALVSAGVDAVHLSAKTVVRDDAGPGGGGDAGYETTDPAVAAGARAALDAAVSR